MTVTGLRSGERISAELHSTPVAVAGIPAADVEGSVTFTVRVPADAAVGAHTLVVSDAAGTVIARLPIEVVDAGAAALASTGSNPIGGLAAVAMVLVVGAVVALGISRRMI